MATVMFGWELGDGFGHVVPMVQLARDLAVRGHSPVLVLKNLTTTWPVWCDLGWPVLPAPVFPQQPTPGGFLRAASPMCWPCAATPPWTA